MTHELHILPHDPYQHLRDFLNIQRESRVWGAQESHESASKSLKLLREVSCFRRMKDVTVQKILMSSVLITAHQTETICKENDDQEFAIFLITGSLVAKNSQSSGERNRIQVFGIGSTIGFEALFSQWKKWPFALEVLKGRVEMMVIHKIDLFDSSLDLLTSFDWMSAYELFLKEKEIQSVTKDQKALFRDVRSMKAPKSTSSQLIRAKGSRFLLLPKEKVTLQQASLAHDSGLASLLRGIPFFRQFSQSLLDALIPYAEIRKFEIRSLIASEKSATLSNSLLVVFTGRLWVFSKPKDDVINTLGARRARGMVSSTITTLWENPEHFTVDHGPFHSIYLPSDAFLASNLSLHCFSLVVDPGTILLQIEGWMDLAKKLNISRCAYKIGTIRLHLWQDKTMQISGFNTVLDNIPFFQHTTKKQMKSLLEKGKMRRFFPKEILIREGEIADRIYVIVAGLAMSPPCIKPQALFQSSLINYISIGCAVGEEDVLQQKCFAATVVAYDEVEALEISRETYECVIWNCRRKDVVPEDVVRNILGTSGSLRKIDLDSSLIKMLKSSEFLAPFPLSIQMELIAGMKLEKFERDSIIVHEDANGGDMFIILSGSVALHMLNTPHSLNPFSGMQDQFGPRFLQGNTLFGEYGQCVHVLGTCESFGEIAFLHQHRHLVTAIARSACVLAKIERVSMGPSLLNHLAEFVANPPHETLDRIFHKDLADRNENDTVLLLHHLKDNPLFKDMTFQSLVECAQQVRRASHICTNGNTTFVASDDCVYMVNRGSMLVKSRDHKLLSIQSPNTSHLLPKVQSVGFRNRTASGERKMSSRNRTLWKWLQIHSQYFGLFVVLQFPSVAENDEQVINAAARLLIRYSVVTLDEYGRIQIFNEHEHKVLGYIWDVSCIKRSFISGFRYVLAVHFYDRKILFATSSIQEGQRLKKSLEIQNEYLKEHDKCNGVLKCGPIWLQMGCEFKLLIVSLKGNGELSYQAGDTLSNWDSYQICNITNCIAITAFPAHSRDYQKSGLELAIEKVIPEEVRKKSVHVLCFSSLRERDSWMDVIGSCCNSSTKLNIISSAEQHERYSKIAQKLEWAAGIFLDRIRSLRAAALDQLKLLDITRVDIHQQPQNHEDTVFIRSGSGVVLNGHCTLLKETEVLNLPLSTWQAIERFEQTHQSDALYGFLQSIPQIRHGSRKDLLALFNTVQILTYTTGDVIDIKHMTSQHVLIIVEGICAFGKRWRHTHTSKKEFLKRCEFCSETQSVDTLKSQAMSSTSNGGSKLNEGVHAGVCLKTAPSKSSSLSSYHSLSGVKYVHDEKQTSNFSDDFIPFMPTESVLLHTGAVISEIPGIDSDLYHVRAKSHVVLMLVQKVLWDDIKSRRPGEESQRLCDSAANLCAKICSHSHDVLTNLMFDMHHPDNYKSGFRQSSRIQYTDSTRTHAQAVSRLQLDGSCNSSCVQDEGEIKAYNFKPSVFSFKRSGKSISQNDKSKSQLDVRTDEESRPGVNKTKTEGKGMSAFFRLRCRGY